MDNSAWRLLVRELTNAGFGDAVSPDLRARLDKPAGVIEVDFRRRFDADEVKGNFQLWKPDRSDHYSLHSFAMQLRKAGHKEWMHQTFQQSGGPYTLREAYNLLSGRPVYKQLEAGGGQPYGAWLKLDFDRKLENGNYARKYYHGDDGFDLGAVLRRYPIRELGDAGKRKALIESLQRGDLAAVTLEGSGETKLYVTPSIPTRSLLVQDEHGIRVSPEKLVPGSVQRVAPVAEAIAARREIKQVGERQVAARRGKRQRLQ